MERIRVLVVDDEPDIRALIKAVLEYDGRYQIVAEAADGAEGVELAAEVQPDVVLLDKSMPRLSGLEALPRLHDAAPSASVVLYTAESDAQVHQAAVAGGAVGVLTKDGHITELAGVLSDALLASWHDQADLFVRIPPVPSDAVLEWTESTFRLLETVRQHPELTDQPISDAMIDTLCRFIELWEGIAEESPEFTWSASAAAADVSDLLEAWASIDRIDEARLAEHGVTWSGPRARVFFDALTGAVVGALERRDARSSLTENLRRTFGG